MRTLLLTSLAVLGLSLGLSQSAQAHDSHDSHDSRGYGDRGYGGGYSRGYGYGGGYSRGYSNWGYGNSGYGYRGGYGGYRYGGYSHPHYDYHPPAMIRHYDHFHFVPGHFHFHVGPH